MTASSRAELTAALADGVRTLQLDLSDAQIGRLMDYLSLLSKWNAVYNLTAVRNPSQMVTQHLLDSLAVVPAFVGAVNILDVGAGGGLPGMVLAIARPDMQVSMIDTVHKKTAFLTQAKAELGLANVTVHTARVEQLQLGMHVQQPFDVITSRAFAELKDFVNWSQHLLQQGGRFIALKGVMPQDEIARLPAGWKVTQVQPLKVPNLDAERHLVFIEREGES
ncbi:16S rRNA (guanine(527)-N(7))-methyltransferase RsmG [Noviherbaspirillum sp. CPCC 100848]|uniref:Ribosomal RNA small subunit methyltransferase G n=1 Tax=Noviherbaspirillum album TaxID=3080276 RepID=A0ABU6JBX9_9BURK|nr:16S rRNA (guanine(527)-N(7))-methyltransferase RsmG [Noviherbaspirillum sp. CPCC 100848]MEC4720659.1 16S rRNA (guanine(527)-N(7))-methyltransferase RsmG [Noviherbaspirillum sp. CPCC 100848]